jgi:hypothetical protein
MSSGNATLDNQSNFAHLLGCLFDWFLFRSAITGCAVEQRFANARC